MFRSFVLIFTINFCLPGFGVAAPGDTEKRDLLQDLKPLFCGRSEISPRLPYITPAASFAKEASRYADRPNLYSWLDIYEKIPTFTALNATILSYTGRSIFDHVTNRLEPAFNFSAIDVEERPFYFVTARGNTVYGTLFYHSKETLNTLVIVPSGTQATSQSFHQRRVAYELSKRGFDVLSLDGRANNAMTTVQSREVWPAMGGFEEAKDMIEVTRALRKKDDTCLGRIVLFGASLGARANLIALSLSGRPSPFERALVVSPMVNGMQDLRLIASSQNPVFDTYNNGIRMFVKKHRDLYPWLGADDVQKMNVYMYFAMVSVPYYTEWYSTYSDELPGWSYRAVPKTTKEFEELVNLYRWPIPKEVPVLLLHAEDDFVVPALSSKSYCEWLRKSGANVRCEFLPFGGHDGIDAVVDSKWYYDEVSRFLWVGAH